MGEKPTASRRAATQKRKEHAAGTAPGAGPPREPMSDAGERCPARRPLALAQAPAPLLAPLAHEARRLVMRARLVVPAALGGR